MTEHLSPLNSMVLVWSQLAGGFIHENVDQAITITYNPRHAKAFYRDEARELLVACKDQLAPPNTPTIDIMHPGELKTQPPALRLYMMDSMIVKIKLRGDEAFSLLALNITDQQGQTGADYLQDIIASEAIAYSEPVGIYYIAVYHATEEPKPFILPQDTPLFDDFSQALAAAFLIARREQLSSQGAESRHMVALMTDVRTYGRSDVAPDALKLDDAISRNTL